MRLPHIYEAHQVPFNGKNVSLLLSQSNADPSQIHFSLRPLVTTHRNVINLSVSNSSVEHPRTTSIKLIERKFGDVVFCSIIADLWSFKLNSQVNNWVVDVWDFEKKILQQLESRWERSIWFICLITWAVNVNKLIFNLILHPSTSTKW